MKESPTQKVSTDLGLIRVDSEGTTDTISLTHNDLKVFTITCRTGKPSRFTIEPTFYTYDESQWEAVFAAYVRWKRTIDAKFKLPNHSGRMLSGRQHPWRMKLPPKRATPQEDED
jgi:hypothetical protein